MLTMLLVAGLITFALTLNVSHFADTNDKKNGDKKDDEKKDKDIETDIDLLKERQSVTKHSITINGKKLNYTATAGTLPLKEEDSGAKAHAFYVAYTLDRQKSAKRPITYCFNGGPGSSSVWLHLGAFGPQKVDVPDDATPASASGQVVKNPETLLDFTDIVFIDPVLTGYSRPTKGEKREQFHGVEEDAKWVAEFIRLFTTRTHRWDSPKFLAGESYGTLRAAKLSNLLQGRHGMYFNGIVLVSCVLDLKTLRFELGNDLPYVLIFPTYAATAWYHKKLDANLQKNLRKTIDEVEAFVRDEYAPALFLGDLLPEAKRKQVIKKMSRYTGLPVDYIDAVDMRIPTHKFTRNLLKDDRRVIGRLDGRYAGINNDPTGEQEHYDPSYSSIQGIYTSAMNEYVRTTLKFESDLPYEILSGRVHPWKWADDHGQVHTSVMPDLQRAMTHNPKMKVMVANGYFDMATPHFASEYTFAHMGLDPTVRENISMTYYEAGHMMYVHGPSHKRLKKDIAKFIKTAL